MNYYIVYGKEFFEESRENIAILIDMVNLSMFKKDPPIMLSNNMEGPLLLHMMLQNLNGDLIR